MHLIEMVLGYGIVSVRNKVIKNKQLAACRYVSTFPIRVSHVHWLIAALLWSGTGKLGTRDTAECSHTTQHANLAAVCGQSVARVWAPINNNNGHRAVLR